MNIKNKESSLPTVLILYKLVMKRSSILEGMRKTLNLEEDLLHENIAKLTDSELSYFGEWIHREADMSHFNK